MHIIFIVLIIIFIGGGWQLLCKKLGLPPGRTILILNIVIWSFIYLEVSGKTHIIDSFETASK